MRHRIPKRPPTRAAARLLAVGGLASAVSALGFLAAGTVLLVGGAFAVLLYLAPYVEPLWSDLPDVGEVADFSEQLFESTVVYSADGHQLGELLSEGRRTILAPEEIPQLIKDATVASEDASFYENPGFDLTAVVRAAWLNLQAQDIVSGFSTITQQVVKNTLLSPEQTLERKLREVVLAYQLSQGLTKDEILALYLNQNNYGNLAYGIAAAAETYFDKPVDQLTLAEASMLVGIPRAPSVQNPFADLATSTRVQHNVLDLMANNRFITQADASAAKAEVLTFAERTTPIGPAPHFFRYVVDYLEDLYGPDVASQGWRVRTTLQLAPQLAAQEAARAHVTQLLADGHQASNAAVVTLDPQSGDILMMIGSVDFDDEAIGGQINMSVARRQPGSAFKPFTYATLLDQGHSPATLFYDIPISIPQFGDEPYEPGNYDRRFRGPVLMRFALANSLNIPAVRAQQIAGVEATLATANAAGLNIVGGADQYGPALALGSAEIRMLDLAAAYGAFGQGGLYHPPNPILEITDSRGQVVSGPHRQPAQPAFDPKPAYLITDMLSDGVTRQAVFGANRYMSVDGHQVAVKTGTTNDFRDSVTAGYSTQLATAVWVGNADYTPMVDVPGSRGALPIWHAAMQAAHDQLIGAAVPFNRPAGLVELAIDPVSGLLPGPYSPTPKNELFAAGSEPFGQDDIHVQLPIHGPSGNLATPETPVAEVELQVFAVLEPRAWDWQATLPADSPMALAPRALATALEYLAAPPGPLLARPADGAILATDTLVTGRPESGAVEVEVSYATGGNPTLWTSLQPIPESTNDPAALGLLPVGSLTSGPVTVRLTSRQSNGVESHVYRTFTVDHEPPQIRLVIARASREVDAGQLLVSAIGNDNERLERVDFYVDDLRLASDPAAPFSASLDLYPGPHQITAVAIDSAGNRASTAPVDLVAR